MVIALRVASAFNAQCGVRASSRSAGGNRGPSSLPDRPRSLVAGVSARGVRADVGFSFYTCERTNRCRSARPFARVDDDSSRDLPRLSVRALTIRNDDNLALPCAEGRIDWLP